MRAACRCLDVSCNELGCSGCTAPCAAFFKPKDPSAVTLKATRSTLQRSLDAALAGSDHVVVYLDMHPTTDSAPGALYAVKTTTLQHPMDGSDPQDPNWNG